MVDHPSEDKPAGKSKSKPRHVAMLIAAIASIASGISMFAKDWLPAASHAYEAVIDLQVGLQNLFGIRTPYAGSWTLVQYAGDICRAKVNESTRKFEFDMKLVQIGARVNGTYISRERGSKGIVVGLGQDQKLSLSYLVSSDSIDSAGAAMLHAQPDLKDKPHSMIGIGAVYGIDEKAKRVLSDYDIMMLVKGSATPSLADAREMATAFCGDLKKQNRMLPAE